MLPLAPPKVVASLTRKSLSIYNHKTLFRHCSQSAEALMLRSDYRRPNSQSCLGAIEELPHTYSVFYSIYAGTPWPRAWMVASLVLHFSLQHPFQKAENSCRGGLPLNLALAYHTLIVLQGVARLLGCNEHKREIDNIANGSWQWRVGQCVASLALCEDRAPGTAQEKTPVVWLLYEVG